MSNHNLIKTAKILLYLTALTPIILAAKFSFPYVTVRTVFFRIIIEVVVIIMLYLFWRGGVANPEHSGQINGQTPSTRDKLKRNYFLWMLLGLLAVELVAAIFGQSFVVSFFSDMERMWGIWTAGHLFLFYLAVRSLFGQREWRIYWHVSLIVSLAVSWYGIIQRFPQIFNIYLFEAGIGRIPSTLGNPTYVAIYLIFNLALALYFLWEKTGRKLKFFYGAVIAVDLFAFWLTGIRGASLGLIAGLGLAMILYLVLGSNKKYKIFLAAALVLLVLIAGLAVYKRDSKLVKSLPVLNNLAAISFSETTAKTRLMGWNAAWQGIKARPFLGVGMENYDTLFDRYMPASYYNLAPTETFFDRAHNQYINLAAESGVLALMFYLGLIFFIAYYLIQGYRQRLIDLRQLLIMSGLFSAYFVHLFFVFDDLNSLLFFMAALAWLEYSCRQTNLINFGAKPTPAARPRALYKFAAIVLIMAAVYSIYGFNYKVAKASRVSAFAYMSSDFKQAVNYYNQSLELRVYAGGNLAANFIDYLTQFADRMDEVKNNAADVKLFNQALQNARLAISREIAYKPRDVFLLMKLGKLNNLAYLFYGESKYIDQAVATLEDAIKLSPERLQLYYILAESLEISGRAKEAIAILAQALALNPDFTPSYYYLGKGYLVDGQLDKAYDLIINRAIKEKKYKPENNLVLLSLAGEYADKKDYGKVAEIYEIYLTFEPKNARIYAALAAVYAQLNKWDQAMAMAEKAARLDSSYRPETDLFVQLIKSGQGEKLKEIINK